MPSKKHKHNQEMKDDFFQDGKGKPAVKYKDVKGKYKTCLSVAVDWLDDAQDDREGEVTMALLANAGSVRLH
ncbi:MAG: hypothetical protein ABSB19_08415 [Methylomonas sp.]|jgi:hypothetical protein